MPLHALQTLLQDRAWPRRLLPLALVQLIPVLGQLILIGYGLEVARHVYTGNTDLPRVRPLTMLAAGVRLFIIALIYCTPLFIFLPMIASVGSTPDPAAVTSASTASSPFSIGLTLLALSLLLTPALKQAQKRGVHIPRVVFIVMRLLPVLGIMSTVISLITNPPTISFDPGRLNSIGFILLLLWLVLMILIMMAVHIGGVRQATDGKGLFDPLNNARLLLQGSGRSVSLIASVLLVWLLTAIATVAGLFLLIVPGLLAFVLGSLTTWVLFARYHTSLSSTQPRADFNQLAPA